jgi:DNA-binding GntR family transcriptional regulator
MPDVSDRLSNQDIYGRIYAAISERKLQPGTKLSEERLAAVFHVSRTRIREVLFRLSQELIVDLHPNRGAFIASPTRDDMRDVFQVRQALERGVVVHLCQTQPQPGVPALQQHLEREAQARARGDSQALAKLTGEFHLRLAEATGNRLFADNLRRLVALTGLIITQYGSQDSSVCTDHEHDDIVRAIEQGQPDEAARLMQAHLHHVEDGIKAMKDVDADTDFESIFGLKKPVSVDQKF